MDYQGFGRFGKYPPLAFFVLFLEKKIIDLLQSIFRVEEDRVDMQRLADMSFSLCDQGEDAYDDDEDDDEGKME